MKLGYYLYFLSSWRLTNKWNRHVYGYILNRYFSRYSLTNSTVASSSLITPTSSTNDDDESLARYFYLVLYIMIMLFLNKTDALNVFVCLVIIDKSYLNYFVRLSYFAIVWFWYRTLCDLLMPTSYWTV